MKKIDAEFTANPEKAKKELGVSSVKFECECLSVFQPTSDSLLTPSICMLAIDLNFSQSYYDTLLDLIDKFFEGELDQQSFEECSRYIFGTKAYLMFTIDKVVHVLAKQIHTLVADETSSTLISVDRIIDSVSTKSLYQYSKQAEELVGSEENLYQANFVS
jgi:histone deacetylase complex regulatory component SIN3